MTAQTETILHSLTSPMVDQNTKMIVYSQFIKGYRPDKFKLYFGCVHCPWRHTDKCSLRNERGLTVIPKEMICKERELWLASLLPEYESIPSITQIRYDLNKALIFHRLEHDREEYENVLKRYSEETDEKNKNILSRLVKSSRTNYERMLKMSIQYDDSTLNREAPKKIELNQVKTIRLEDMHNILRTIKINSDKEKAVRGELADGTV